MKTPISDKFEAEFSYSFSELVEPLANREATVIMSLKESVGLVVRDIACALHCIHRFSICLSVLFVCLCIVAWTGIWWREEEDCAQDTRSEDH